MALGEIDALSKSFSTYLSLIQEFGNNYFLVDVARDQFPVRVQLLQAKHKSLNDDLQRYGSRLNPFVLEAVKVARQLLDKEVARLERESEHSCCPVCRPISEILFPKSVGLRIGSAEDAFNSIIDFLKNEKDRHDMWDNIATSQVSPLGFGKDSRYVPRKIFEQKIFSALERAGPGPAVVLLSGGPGKGKSTLAREVSLRYREGNSTLFTQVVMLECGSEIDIAAKQTELLQKLRGDLSSSLQDKGNESTVLRALQNLLSDPKLFIVLDDLWEPELICSLIHLSDSSFGAKYLVTSRQGNICAKLNPQNTTLVDIGDLERGDARKILASHAGVQNQDIPQPLQEVAEKIITQAEGSPLIIATLGARIATAGPYRPEVWEEVSNSMVESLDRDPKVHTHGIEYSSSFFVTMKNSVDILRDEQKQFLVLMGLCKGPSIPETALQFLYRNAVSRQRCTMLDFLEISSDLKNRNLVFEKDKGYLSIHSLTKVFILEQLRDTVHYIASLVNDLKADRDTQDAVAIEVQKTSMINVLVYLYLGVDSAKLQIDPQIDHLLDLHTSDGTDKVSVESKRAAVESIIRLVVVEPREEVDSCVHQVLKDFVCNDHLSDGDISKLLASPATIMPILTFLDNVCLLEGFWKNSAQDISGVSYALLNILQRNCFAECQARAVGVLGRLCWCHEHNSETVANVSGMLPQLAVSLTQAQNPELQGGVADLLKCCARWDIEYRRNIIFPKILEVPGLLNSLVDLLANDENDPLLQYFAAGALRNLAWGIVREGDLARWPAGLLEALAKSLTKNDYPPLQMQAAAALGNLGTTDDNTILNEWCNHSGLVDELVKSLSADQNVGVQIESARALCNLMDAADSNDTVRLKMAAWPGLLEGLTKSWTKGDNYLLQIYAATALACMTNEDESVLGNKLVNNPRVMDDLVKSSLYEDQNFSLLEQPLTILHSLTGPSFGSTITQKMAEWPGLLDGVANSLINSDKLPLPLQELVAGTLANIATTNESTFVDKLVNHFGLVDRLVKLLYQDQSPGLQKESARALCNLTGTDAGNTIKQKMAEWPGLLGGLDKSLASGDNPLLQEYAASTLANIADIDESTTVHKLVIHSGLVDKLMKLLHHDQNPGLQKESARALFNLTEKNAASTMKQKIV